MTTPAHQSSSDHALRYRAPSCLAQRWRSTNTYFEEPGERLKRRLAFVETALRFLVAMLAAEHAAGRCPPARGWDALCATLGKKPVSLGLWLEAARDLSLAVIAQPEPILADLASVFADRPPGESPRATAVVDDARRLVEIRNRDAHAEVIAAGVSGERLEASEESFRRLLAALRVVGRAVPWVASRCKPERDGSFVAELHCLRGVEPMPPRRVSLLRPVLEGAPFVVAPGGAVLYVTPLLCWGTFARSRGPELRLFSDWKGGPRYSDPIGLDEPSLPPGEVPGHPGAWWELGTRNALVPGVVPTRGGDLVVLRDPERGEVPPVLPGYTVGARLGYGGNGHVYTARSQEGLQVAVKVLSQALGPDHPARERLHREYLAMRKVQHANVARVYDFLPDTPAGPTLVLEFVVGTNLRNRVESRPLSLTETVSVMEQVLGGLAAAHAAGIVHRDVTPENVVLDPQGRAKLIDFGIASLEGQERLTATLDGLGKVNFAAPEQIARPTEAGPPADVYAAGRLLGFLPSASVEPHAQLAALPGALQALVIRATDPDPARRFVDARAMLAALSAARAAGWEGAPVGPGDQLAPGLSLSAVCRALGDGLWLADVDDTMHAERLAAVVAERRDAAEAALASRLRGLSPARRAALGQPRVSVTREGVRWCLLAGGDRDLAVSVFLGADVAITADRAPTVVAAEVLTEVVAEVAAPVDPPAPVPSTGPGAWSPPPSTAPTPPSTAPPPGTPAVPARRWVPGGPGTVTDHVGALTLAATVACALAFPFGLAALPLVYLFYAKATALPAPPPGPLPPPLSRAVPVDGRGHPGAALLVLDDLATLVLLQRAALGAPADPPVQELRADPGRAAFYVLGLDARRSPAAHRAAVGSRTLRRRAQFGLSFLFHRAPRAEGPERLPPYATLAGLLLSRLVHAGQLALAKLPPPGVLNDGERWRLATGEVLDVSLP